MDVSMNDSWYIYEDDVSGRALPNTFQPMMRFDTAHLGMLTCLPNQAWWNLVQYHPADYAFDKYHRLSHTDSSSASFTSHTIRNGTRTPWAISSNMPTSKKSRSAWAPSRSTSLSRVKTTTASRISCSATTRTALSSRMRMA